MKSNHDPSRPNNPKETATTGPRVRGRRYNLGDGGSGGEAAKRRLQQIQRSTGISGSPPWLATLACDNDAGHQPDFADGQFYHWGPTPLADFLRAKLRHPAQFPGLNRFGDINKQLEELKPIEVVVNGCHGDRVVGALVYTFWAETEGHELCSRLLTPVLELSGRAEQSTAPNGADLPDHAPGEFVGTIVIDVSLSPGGAKGSSAGLCNSWLLHSLLANIGITGYRIDSTLFLPETFNTNRQGQIQASTHAYLLELKATYTESLSPMQIGSVTVDRRPPFSLIKLNNGVNGDRVYTQEQVHEIDAACWQLSTEGPIAVRLESLIPNILDEQKWPNIAYSQNYKRLVLPVNELMHHFALRTLVPIQETHLVRPDAVATVQPDMKAMAKDLLGKAQLTPNKIQTLFQEDRSAHTFAVDLSAYRALNLKQLQAAVAAYEKAKVPLWAQELARLSGRQTKDIVQTLAQEVERMLNEYGLAATISFLSPSEPDEESSTLADFLADLDRILKRKHHQVERALERQRALLAAPEPLAWRTFPQQFHHQRRKRWHKHKHAELSQQVALAKLDAALSLVRSIVDWVQQQRDALAAWSTSLQQSAQQLRQQEGQYRQQRQQRPVQEENILSQEDEEQLFEQRHPAVYQGVQQDLSFVWHVDRDDEPGNWVLAIASEAAPTQVGCQPITTPEGIALLVGHVERKYAFLTELDIEQVLADQGRDPSALVHRMESQATPLVAIDRVAHQLQSSPGAPSLRHEVFLGTPHGAQGWFADCSRAQGFQLAATGHEGRHQIDLLSILFHVNPFALQQSAEYKRAYDSQRAAGKLLHIFDEAELNLNQSPKPKRRRRRTAQVKEES